MSSNLTRDNFRVAVNRPRIDFDWLPQRRCQAGILSRKNGGLTYVAEITAGGGGSFRRAG